jgi:8-oxo-dGTP pyrophosphatase MutT (NUDIX family)
MVSMGDSKKGEIEILEPDMIFSNKYVEIFNDRVKFPSGNLGTYIRINTSTNRSVGVLPVTDEGNIVVIRNYRHAVRGWGIEIPKGAVEPNESNEDAVRRELEEETGYVCQKLIHVCEYSESPAIFSSKIDCFIALGCRCAHTPNAEHTEAIETVAEISLDDFLKRNYEADFIDSLSELMAYHYYFMRGAHRQ